MNASQTDYTPTTEEDPALEDVRGWYIDGRRVHNPFASDAELVARFDRWLAQHDAEVAAKAVREALAALPLPSDDARSSRMMRLVN